MYVKKQLLVEGPTLRKAPTSLFMTLRDIAFWVRSARSDATLAKLQTTMGLRESLDQLYRSKCDPWGATLRRFRYQRQKYETLISMLPRRQYDNVLDVGCGLGEFARQLTPYAGQILAIDISSEAIAQARRMSKGLAKVRYAQADIYDFGAHGRCFDLIVLADVLYYMTPLTDRMLKVLAEKIAGLLAPDGLLLLANHYFFKIDQASRQTRYIHDFFRRSSRLVSMAEYAGAFYLATIVKRS
jgi:2-polyprenyl-3-methyl-5-hydroxy-6-metoxy-1,4-benzoquinol methylase